MKPSSEMYAWTPSGCPPAGEQGNKEGLKRPKAIADVFDVISGAGKAFHRTVWVFIVLACFAVFVIQVKECVDKLRTPPITTQSQVLFNESLEFPSLTICHRQGFKRSIMQAYGLVSEKGSWFPSSTSSWKRFPWAEEERKNLTKFWQEVSYKPNETIRICGVGGNEWGQCPVSFLGFAPENTTSMTLTDQLSRKYGRCYTLTPKPDVRPPPGKSYALKTVLSSDPQEYLNITGAGTEEVWEGWSVFVHSSRDKWSEYATIGGTLQEELQVSLGESLVLKVQAADYKTLNTHEHRCIEDPAYTIVQCLERCLWRGLRTVGCRGPWVDDVVLPIPQRPSNQAQVFTNFPVPVCDLYANFSRYLIEEKKMEPRFKESFGCSCPRPCTFRQYSTAVLNRAFFERYSKDSTGEVILYFPKFVSFLSSFKLSTTYFF
ncbi:unnamed protein product [Darwinula stevensoni]|uniref:Uncharacterized protein n=1 Tax=Darwinula stevensoni TaxID=69355 RepID=A0A7R9A2V4_9CRUS|nr:unnamed protein product [Darwinula stevensoni]CAG0880715.1 unnamed protein product [Darwinula stevensoni]